MVEPTPTNAAERALTDALTAPATPAELAREAEYVQAFMATRAPLHDRIFAAPAGVAAPAREAPAVPLRRRRLRIALAGGLAAVAVTGTAAALSTTLSRSDAPQPSQSAGPLPPGSTTGARSSGTGTPGQASATGGVILPGTTPGTTPGTSPGTTPGSTGTNGGPTSAPGVLPPGTPSASHGPVTTGSTPAPTSSTPSPGPSNSTRAAPIGELRASCKAFVAGKLKPGSHRYDVLVAAAGGIDEVPDYCAALLGG